MPLRQGVVDLLGHPPLSSLKRSTTVPYLLDNPLSGAAVLNAQVSGVPAYGLQWTVVTAPSGAGRSDRAGSVYELEFLHLALNYSLADSSFIFGEHFSTGVASGVLMFDNGPPWTVSYDISNGWTLNFHWLIAP